MTTDMRKNKGEPSSLRMRISCVLLAAALLPLLIIAVGVRVVSVRLLDEKALELQMTVVRSHAGDIESDLHARLDQLRLLADTHTLDDMSDHTFLESLFNSLNKTSGGGFVDLGIIGQDGRHRAYVGEYDLMDKNYSDAEWFRSASVRGEYISDVFLGYRNVPHCIIAVKKFDGARSWIIRATINGEQFESRVRTGVPGAIGQIYIVNRAGLYQTTPKAGSLLDRAPLENIEYFQGMRSEKLAENGSVVIRVTTWINDNNWLLVAEQDEQEVRAPVYRAIAFWGVFVILAVILLIVATLFATWHLTRQIEKANRKREEMVNAFARSAKLASVGELATGLAHEINNPLAVISADQTNIADIIADMKNDSAVIAEIRESVDRSKRQIDRCKNITTKMLQFGRNFSSEQKLTDISGNLREITAFLERQARVRNIALDLSIGENLPPVLIDAVELEQVIVNLLNNAFQAMTSGGRVTVSAKRAVNEVVIEVSDNGPGMPPEVRQRIFEPFFTTKPAGQGTGLGLSVCYGIVESWHGSIEVDSTEGSGTVMRIRIPCKDE